MEIKVGEKAPEFCLPDQNGKEVCLNDFAGKWVLVYFYPKDDTPGCTKEACSFRDNFLNLNRLNLNVVGISKDNVASHLKFANKYNLTFPLLADTEVKVIKDYGVWRPKKFLGREFLGTVRTSFLINPEGKIAKIYENVKPEGHVAEILEDLKNFRNSK